MIFKLPYVMFLTSVYISHSHAQQLPTCETVVLKQNIHAIKDAMNNGNRPRFVLECNVFKGLVSVCQTAYGEDDARKLRDSYTTACESENVQKWLSSNAPQLRSTYIVGTVLIFYIMFTR